MRRTPGAIEAESGLEEERPEVRVNVRRDLASDLGVGIGTIALTLRPALAGQKASTWEDPSGEQHDVIVQLPRVSRSTLEQLAGLPLTAGTRDPQTGTPRILRLGHVADITESTSPQKIERRDMKRVVWITANFDGRTLTEVSGDIEREVRKLAMPAGYSFKMGGETQDFHETVGHILESLTLAVVFIYLVLHYGIGRHRRLHITFRGGFR